MKPAPILISLLGGFVAGNAQQLAFKEVRSASDTVLVGVFKDAHSWGEVWDAQFNTNQVNTDERSLWKLNREPVMSIDQFVAEADAVDYHILERKIARAVEESAAGSRRHLVDS